MDSTGICWRKIDNLDSAVSLSEYQGERILSVDTDALEVLAREAFHDISHFLRTGHLVQLK